MEDDESFGEGQFNIFEEDAKIDEFSDKLQQQWGTQESLLRSAIFIQFVKPSSRDSLMKNVRKSRETVLRRASKDFSDV